MDRKENPKRRVKEGIKEEIMKYLRKKNTVNKKELLDELKVHSYHLDKILDELVNEGRILVTRVESVSRSGKMTVQAVIVQCTKKECEKTKKNGHK